MTGLGRDNPTLFLSNNLTTSAREIVIRCAGRNRIEDGLGISVNFFHFDCLASEVRLNVDLDAALTADPVSNSILVSGAADARVAKWVFELESLRIVEPTLRAVGLRVVGRRGR